MIDPIVGDIILCNTMSHVTPHSKSDEIFPASVRPDLLSSSVKMAAVLHQAVERSSRVQLLPGDQLSITPCKRTSALLSVIFRLKHKQKLKMTSAIL